MKVVMNYADNTALVSILYDEKEEHSPVLKHFINWSEQSNHLETHQKLGECILEKRHLQTLPLTVCYIYDDKWNANATGYWVFQYLSAAIGNKLKWHMCTGRFSTENVTP